MSSIQPVVVSQSKRSDNSPASSEQQQFGNKFDIDKIKQKEVRTTNRWSYHTLMCLNYRSKCSFLWYTRSKNRLVPAWNITLNWNRTIWKASMKTSGKNKNKKHTFLIFLYANKWKKVYRRTKTKKEKH